MKTKIKLTVYSKIIYSSGTSLRTLQGLIDTLYTGSIPNDCNIASLGEAACLLQLESLAAFFHKALTDPSSIYQQQSINKAANKHPGPIPDLHAVSGGEKPQKKERSNRLEKLISQKFHLGNIAQELPHPPILPVPSFPSTGILGELLTKTDFGKTPLNFPNAYQELEHSRSTGSTPLNLSKSNKKSTDSHHYGGVAGIHGLNLGDYSMFNNLPSAVLQTLVGGMNPLHALNASPSGFSSLLSQSAAIAASETSKSAFSSSSLSRNRSNKPSSSSKKSLSKNSVTIEKTSSSSSNALSSNKGPNFNNSSTNSTNNFLYTV